MNVFGNIKEETAGLRSKTAVVEGTRRVSYGELVSLAEAAALTLREKGVGKYDRAALVSADSIEMIALTLAVLSIPAVVVPISPRHTDEEKRAIIKEMAVEHVLFEEGSANVKGASSILPGGPSGRGFFHKRLKPDSLPPSEYYGMNPAFIRFSSGTTGQSKGVVLSHEGIIERTDAADRGLVVTEKDTVMWVLSMSFHFVVTILLYLRRGATIVLCGDRFPESFIEGMSRMKGTILYASPFHFGLLARTDMLKAKDMNGVRLAVSTAMKLQAEAAAAFRERFGVELAEAYGIIEVGLPFINLSPDASKRGSLGRALPDYEVEIRGMDKDGVGEIMLRGKGMLDAYFSPWRTRAEILKDGWFSTGDLGRLDEDGCLTVVGREKNVINYVGMKVFPYEVEAVLGSHPLVRESLVYGAPHADYGQLPMAKVVLREGAEASFDEHEIRRFCFERLAGYKVPKGFEVVGSLVKTSSGKLKR